MKTILTIKFQNKTIELRKECFNSKINANGGAAPWMIGRSIKSSKTMVFVDGEYEMDFPFNLKIHKQGGIAAKNQLDQLYSYL